MLKIFVKLWSLCEQEFIITNITINIHNISNININNNNTKYICVCVLVIVICYEVKGKKKDLRLDWWELIKEKDVERERRSMGTSPSGDEEEGKNNEAR